VDEAFTAPFMGPGILWLTDLAAEASIGICAADQRGFVVISEDGRDGFFWGQGLMTMYVPPPKTWMAMTVFTAARETTP
jgi:hypothetical protein